MRGKGILASTLLMFSLFLGQLALAQNLDDLNAQLNSGNPASRIHAAKVISSSAIDNPEIFATINAILLANLENRSQEELFIDEMSWMCKALASSGEPRYEDTLNQVLQSTSNKKLRNYAQQSIELIPYYAKRNRQINQPGEYAADFTPEEVQIANMLRSDLIQLKRDGAKKLVRFGSTQQGLFDIVEEELLAGYQINGTDNLQIDAMSWLCKALMSSGNPKYAATLDKVARESKNRKLKDYAKKGVKMLRANTPR